MDGTLTNAIHDFDAIRSQLKLPAGKPILESINRLPTAQGVRTTQALHALEMDIAAQATQQPGAERLLNHLRRAGHDLGILTRNGKDIALATLNACGLDEYFPDHLVVSRDCAAPKPNPAGIHVLLSHWQAKAPNSVMVGDYLFDLQAGFDAGTLTVHLANDGQYHWPEHTSVGVQSLDDLLMLVNKGA